jgi:PadR family transcriptional regulator, regulatory protein PadR
MFSVPIRVPPIAYRWIILDTRAALCFHRQTMGNDLLPGTLDMLVLSSLTRGARHGYGIAQHLKKISADVLDVGESSLYPALQRLLLNGRVSAEWGASENNRRARYYKLTAAGRKQLAAENKEFGRMILAIQKVLSCA